MLGDVPLMCFLCRGEGQAGSRARTACPHEGARDTEAAGRGASSLGDGSCFNLWVMNCFQIQWMVYEVYELSKAKSVLLVHWMVWAVGELVSCWQSPSSEVSETLREHIARHSNFDICAESFKSRFFSAWGALYDKAKLDQMYRLEHNEQMLKYSQCLGT